MTFGLQGKHAVVIGGTSGIGRATTAALLKAGCTVHATGVAASELESCAADPVVSQARMSVLNITDSDAVDTFFAGLDRLDIMVNAAGVGGRGPENEFSEKGFAFSMDVNLTGTMRVCLAAQPLLARQGGSIVTICSMMSFFGSPTAPAYSASKGGVMQLTKSLAVAWGKDGIRVNGVAPGWIDTPMTKPLQADAERNAKVLSRSPMGRWGKPEEIADGILFLCSPSASFISGIILPIDGGYLTVGI
jgi:NAD(P)-dependent dehydrogenase (short-subunit alcohol dehydrogenase family)